MNILLDQDKFAKLAQYCLDACEVSLFFKAHDGEVQYIPPVMCEICQEIRKVPGLYKECQACSARAFRRCHETRQVQIYPCHMGFTEVVLPVMLDSLFIDYLSFGQIIHAEQPGCEQRILERLEAAFRLHGFVIEDYKASIRTPPAFRPFPS